MPKRTLLVARADLLGVLKKLSIRQRGAVGELASLSCSHGIAAIDVGSSTHTFRAQGRWGGEARFAASVLVALKKFPPVGDPVEISFDKNELQIETLKVGASWSSLVVEKAVLPDDSDWVQTLLAARDQQGITRPRYFEDRLRTAQRELNKRIGRAALELSPLGITQSDIQALVQVRFLESPPKAP